MKAGTTFNFTAISKKLVKKTGGNATELDFYPALYFQ